MKNFAKISEGIKKKIVIVHTSVDLCSFTTNVPYYQFQFLSRVITASTPNLFSSVFSTTELFNSSMNTTIPIIEPNELVN